MTDIDNSMNEALAASRARFVTAANNPRTLTPKDHADVDTITSAVIGLGAQIELLVPKGRNQSLALTALEDVLTRANKGIYVDRSDELPLPARNQYVNTVTGDRFFVVDQVPGMDAYNAETPDGEKFIISGQTLATECSAVV